MSYKDQWVIPRDPTNYITWCIVPFENGKS